MVIAQFPHMAQIASLLLRKQANQCRNIQSLVNLAFHTFQHFPFTAWQLRPIQVQMEITQLLQLLALMSPRTILEIGTAQGGTLFLFTRVTNPDGVIISVDLPHGLFGGGYPSWKLPFYQSFAVHQQHLHLLRANSHSTSTLHTIQTLLQDQPLDFLFIDGDHTYEGVKTDFAMYSPLVTPGGIIAFHDIVSGPEEKVSGVPKFWQELKQHLPHQELVADWQQSGKGIGVLYD